MKLFNNIISDFKMKVAYNGIFINQLLKCEFEIAATNFIYGFFSVRPSTGNNALRFFLWFKNDTNIPSNVTVSQTNYETGVTTSTTIGFNIIENELFSNQNIPNRFYLPTLTNDLITAANNTANEIISEYGGYKCVNFSINITDTTQKDFAIVTNAGSFLYPENSMSTSAPFELSNGFIFDTYIGGYYENSDVWDLWLSNPDIANGYGVYLGVYPFILASGNLETEIDYENPFIPLPDTFYLTVNCQTDANNDGEQALTFTWTPSNSDETNLSGVILHFDFVRGLENYEITVPYYSNSYSITYVEILKLLNVEWWINIVKHLPIIGEQLVDSDINVRIWWSQSNGDAGYCYYVIQYDGQNYISTEKAQDPITEWWTYLTASTGTDVQNYDDPYNPYDSIISFTGGTDSVNGSALLTTSYALTVANTHTFGDWLWGTGFDLDELKLVVNNPIENIVACKLFPFDVTGGTSTVVKLGNVASSVVGNKLPENVARTFNFGGIHPVPFFNSFLDYAPYTSVKIYLPYIGFKEIDPFLIYDKTVFLTYYVDLVTGVCRAVLFSQYQSGYEIKRFEIMSFDGVIGQDVPVVGSNRAQVEAGYIIGGMQSAFDVVSGLGNLVVGNVGAGLSQIGSAISVGISTAMQSYHTYNSGTPSPALSRFDSQRAFIIVDSPVYTEPKLYAHQNGHVCNLNARLADLHGFTVVDNTIDLSTLTCNTEERDEIMRLLTNGIYC